MFIVFLFRLGQYFPLFGFLSSATRGAAQYSLTFLFDCFLESLSLLDRQFAALLPLFFVRLVVFFILYYYFFVFL